MTDNRKMSVSVINTVLLSISMAWGGYVGMEVISLGKIAAAQVQINIQREEQMQDVKTRLTSIEQRLNSIQRLTP